MLDVVMIKIAENRGFDKQSWISGISYGRYLYNYKKRTQTDFVTLKVTRKSTCFHDIWRI